MWDTTFRRVVPKLLKNCFKLATSEWRLVFSAKALVFLHWLFSSTLEVKINTSTFGNANAELVASHVAAMQMLQDRLRKLQFSLKTDQLNTKNYTSTTTLSRVKVYYCFSNKMFRVHKLPLEWSMTVKRSVMYCCRKIWDFLEDVAPMKSLRTQFFWSFTLTTMSFSYTEPPRQIQ